MRRCKYYHTAVARAPTYYTYTHSYSRKQLSAILNALRNPPPFQPLYQRPTIQTQDNKRALRIFPGHNKALAGLTTHTRQNNYRF